MQESLSRKKIRLKNHDYSNDGYYFVTICTKNREHMFGEIIKNRKSVGANGCWPDNHDVKIKLNEFGLIVEEELKNTEDIRNEIKLDQYIIMPNHLHSIIIINRAASQPPLRTMLNVINRKQTLSSFISGLKSVVTKRINVLRNTPGKSVWQRSFHDHIIRNNESLNQIREYIANNHLTWETDKNNI